MDWCSFEIKSGAVKTLIESTDEHGFHLKTQPWEFHNSKREEG